jgi:hypothetical protein
MLHYGNAGQYSLLRASRLLADKLASLATRAKIMGVRSSSIETPCYNTLAADYASQITHTPGAKASNADFDARESDCSIRHQQD